MKKKLLLSFLMFMPLLASALDINYTDIKGIYYRFDSSTQTAAVTCKSLYYEGEEGPNPDGVTSGNYSGSLVIPPEVTYNGISYKVTRIWNFAFYGCSNLTSITIPESITSIGNRGVFVGCNGLTSIVVKNGNPKYDSRDNCNAIIESESNILVQGCKNTVIPNNVSSIGNSAFYGCSGLESIAIPNNVSSIGNSAFYGCSGLESIAIPNSVTSIGWSAFSGCSGLTSINIPDKVTSIESGTFEKCSSLKSITIPAGMTSIGVSAFDNCQGLTHVYCWAENAPSASSAFRNCNLGNIALHVPNSSYQRTQPWSSFGDIVPLSGYEFEIVDNTNISFADPKVKAMLVKLCDIGNDGEISVLEAAALTNGQFKNLSLDKNIVSFDEFQYFTGVTEIPSSKFSGCSSLTSIIIPNNVTSIGSEAFYQCSSLTSVTIPNSVTSIGHFAFSGCSSLTSVTIGIKVSSITGGAFPCSHLTDVYCLAEDVPNATVDAFRDTNSSVDYAPNITLHVPESSIEAYSQVEPWKNVKEIVPLTGEGQQIERCAKPTITYENGEFIFSCATEGAELHYEISSVNQSTGVATKLKASPAFTISVYATKVGFYNSETATDTFTGLYGDLNNDGEVNVADHVELSKIILNQE